MTFLLHRSTRTRTKLTFGAVVITIGVFCSLMFTSLAGGETAQTTASSSDRTTVGVERDITPAIGETHDIPVVAVDTGGQRQRLWTKGELIRWLERWVERFFLRRIDDGGWVKDPPTPDVSTTTSAPTTVVTPTTEASGESTSTTQVTTTKVPPTTKPTTTTKSPGTKPTATEPTATTGPTTTKRTTTTKPPATEPTATTDPSPTTAPSTTSAPPRTTPPGPSSGNLFRVTVGSGGSTALDNSSQPDSGSAHGTRVYCVSSHFSYDDPVVFPGQPRAAHAHMFWGNSDADAFSTGESLQTSGNSSCEGGTTNRSSYWMPAMFNSANEATLPESIFVYYKSFGGPGFQRSTIQPIPSGLQMLASKNVPAARDDRFRVGSDGSGTRLEVWFPECVAVDRNGRPILASDNNVSHLSYATNGSAANGCPASHPYRIPSVAYVVHYAIPFDSGWYLASDHDTASKGQSLHADYIAAWDEATMDQVVECVIRERRSCEFPGRSQLPERFFDPSGKRIYQYSVLLEADADRTPFGTQIQKHSP